MDINKYINAFGKYGPIYASGFTNHLPMAQYSLYALGCDESNIRSFSDNYIKHTNLVEINDYNLVGNSFDDNKGNTGAYGSYVTYFTNELEIKETKRVVGESLNKLSKGMSTSLFHCIIRLSFAVKSDNKGEIIRALAYFSSSYTAHDVDAKAIKSENLYKDLSLFMKNQDEYFYLEEKVDIKELKLLDGLCDLYLSTASFVVLHTITAFEALTSLKAYFYDYDRALDIFTIGVLGWLKRASREKVTNVTVEEKASFEEMKEVICSVKDAHTIKLLYSSEVLYNRFANEKLKKVAKLKLKIDHGL